jgi:tRNA (Thr-GGU) A37 N-methylase
MSVVRLVRIDGTNLKVVGLDCLDGTPLVDLKPYFASVDSVPEATVGRYQEEKA